ncbi:sortase B protein-sorting domain-containing protein [Catenibacterium sp. CAG:290]|uniref:sortase B protein-sorting domain-containing protein n=1 Tax=Catenibacterium sp. CAG:290 TaxID=1262767 RepID=UPI00338D68AD
MKTEVVLNKKQVAKKEEKDKTPAKTGDNTQLAVFAILFLLSGIYLLRRMKKS